MSVKVSEICFVSPVIIKKDIVLVQLRVPRPVRSHTLAALCDDWRLLVEALPDDDVDSLLFNHAGKHACHLSLRKCHKSA